MSTGSTQLLATLRAPTSAPVTDQARRVLSWLERWLPSLLADLPAESRGEYETRYRCARAQVGRPARHYPRLLYGQGPRVSGLRMAVSGSADAAHDHTRVSAIIQEVIIPLLESGHLEPGQARELRERLRGSFAVECPKAFRALDRALHADQRTRQQHEKENIQ